MHFRKAFNLIEILVVLVIIGILATITYSLSASAKIRTRDARRKTDLQLMRTAIVLYKSTQGSYPNVNTANCTTGGGALPYDVNWGILSTQLKPYINPLPLDPQGQMTGGTCPVVSHPWLTNAPYAHGYAYITNNPTSSQYAVWASLENANDADHNGVSAQNENTSFTLGKYSGFYNYATFTSAVKALPVQNDNVANLYAIGCRVVGTNCLDN